jgi:hypothetical protein
MLKSIGLNACVGEVAMVAKQDLDKLGTKYLCFSCETKFYDLNKPEPVCPKCETSQLEKPVGEPPKIEKSAVRAKPETKPDMERLLGDGEAAAGSEEEIDEDAAAAAQIVPDVEVEGEEAIDPAELGLEEEASKEGEEEEEEETPEPSAAE